MRRMPRWLVNGLAVLSSVVCLATAAFAIHACYYMESLTWWSALDPQGHQDEILIEPYVGLGELRVVRWSYALKDQARYVNATHGYPPRNDPTSGFVFRPPRRYTPIWGRSFRNDHRLFGLFSFQFERINLDLARDWGPRLHVYENGGRVYFPLWAPALLFGLFPAILLFKRRRERKRLTVGFCAICGYDLRATPDRCPECGASVSKARIA